MEGVQVPNGRARRSRRIVRPPGDQIALPGREGEALLERLAKPKASQVQRTGADIEGVGS